MTGLPRALKDKIAWDRGARELTIRQPLTAEEAQQVAGTVTDAAAQAAIVQAGEVSRTSALEVRVSPAESSMYPRCSCGCRESYFSSTILRCWTIPSTSLDMTLPRLQKISRRWGWRTGSGARAAGFGQRWFLRALPSPGLCAQCGL